MLYKHGRRRQSSSIQFFKFAENVRKNYVKQAILHVYIKSSGWSSEDVYSQTSVNLEILKVIKSPKRKESNNARYSVFNNTVVLPSVEGKWYKINITNVVDEWFRFPRNNLGIEIIGLDRKGKHAVVLDHDFEDGSMVPYIEVYTEDGRRRRFKREISNDCTEDSNTTLCCRFPLKVDFEEFGWDWVIAPKTYEAHYCNGDCPYIYLQKNPHTHIVHLARPTGSPGPCCAPRQMSPISMLYFDADLNIVYGTLPGMVVDRCGCS
ncbi:growth/differentiation factor 8-like [Ctenocephalides felis]|uniref:growth/differentiation factor 8-like n=1 Tax=Ctenocephalides felis TaxID=7515 RepID=UPI000E6E3CF7|nr:growth/differentiation factor 8-like [Ctenocephalides felis]